jgi:hypothetical protein
MEFTHERFGKCVFTDLTQKQMEEYSKAMKGKGEMPLQVWRGDSVRAVAKLGLMTEPEWKPEDIDNAKPGHIYWISECIAEWIAEALNIDPLS